MSKKHSSWVSCKFRWSSEVLNIRLGLKKRSQIVGINVLECHFVSVSSKDYHSIIVNSSNMAISCTGSNSSELFAKNFLILEESNLGSDSQFYSACGYLKIDLLAHCLDGVDHRTCSWAKGSKLVLIFFGNLELRKEIILAIKLFLLIKNINKLPK